MITRENLNNKINNINAQIKNIDRVIKNFKNSIDNIRKQISYREEFANLNRAIPLEREPKKKADLEKRKKVVEDLIDDMSFNIPQLQAAQQHIQSLMDPEINKKELLKQELEGYRGERSALPKRWATGKNIRNGAIGIAALAAVGMGINYFVKNGQDGKPEKWDSDDENKKEYVIPPEIKDDTEKDKNTTVFPGVDTATSQRSDTVVYDASRGTPNKKKEVKNSKEIHKIPDVDNYEFYNAMITFNDEKAKDKSSLAYQNYLAGSFKYEITNPEFLGSNSFFWRQRNVELGRDAYDKRIPLKPGERVEKLKEDQLMITDFSLKEGEKFDRAIIKEKGTEVIVDSNGHIVAIGECCNPVHVSKVLCPPEKG